MANQIISNIRQALINRADENTKVGSDRYHKPGEAPKVHGVRMGKVSKIGKYGFQQIKHLPKQKIFQLCEDL